MQTINAVSKNNDYFTSEFGINETPIAARNLLTKGFIQDEISIFSGAAISTRGRYMPKGDHGKNANDKPLYLFIQGSTKQSIEMAIQKIEEIIKNDMGTSGRQNYSRLNESASDIKHASAMQAEKIFIGLDNLPSSFDLRSKIIGQGGSNLQYIRSETGAAVSLRGRGSQYVDPQLGHESPEALHLYIEHTQPDGLVAARQLALNLIETLVQELQITSELQQQQNVNASSTQILSLPPHIITMPPISVPPPQQQFSTVQQQPQNIEQPVLLNNSNEPLQGQMQHIRNQQIQHVQPVPQQQQQVILQQPPPIARAPIVSIPPPGIHIPQHPGPIVPPPQIVQLSAPPPTAASSGNVLVVAPPPTQSIYLPPEVGSSSSIASFSFLQGGVLYHQAPPIQTQAQIGDGLHIISAPPQATVDNVNMSMNSHSQPPPHMIITQVQIDPNSQNSGKQIFQQPVVSQQQKPQYHVIGHVQGTLNQDQGNLQPTQAVLQQHREIHNMDNFTQYTVNSQVPTSTSMVLTFPYHMSSTVNTTNVSTISVSQNPLQQLGSGIQNQSIQIQHSEQDSSMKQLPGQVIQTGLLPIQQRQRNERTPIAVQIAGSQIQTSQPPITQPTLEQIMLTQPPNTPTILSQISHVPPNQLTSQMPPNQLQSNSFLTSQPVQQHMQNSIISGQPNNQVLVSSQELCQVSNSQTSLNQVSSVPPNQILSQLPPNQMTASHLQTGQIPNQDQLNQQISLQQSIQSQVQRQFNQGYDSSLPRQDRIQDNTVRNRINQGNRNRKQSRNRQNSYPWVKSDQEKGKYQNSDSSWPKREGDRNFEFDRKHDEYNNECRSRYQQNNDRSLYEDRKSHQLEDKDRTQYDNEKKSYTNNSNSNNQKNYQYYDKKEGKSQETSGNNWKRNEKSETISDDTSTESTRKRKYDSDTNWSNRAENNQLSTSSESSTSGHKSRFEPEESVKSEQILQQKQNSNKSSTKGFGQNEQSKPDKETSSKWMEQSVESARCGNNNEKIKPEETSHHKADVSRNIEQSSNSTQSELNTDKHEQSKISKFIPPNLLNNQAAWNDQQSEYKGNMQYSTSVQYQLQNMNETDKQYSSNIQQAYVPNMFPNNMSYLLPPPPPPPPQTRSQNNIPHSMQFNLTQCNTTTHIPNTPPNIQVMNNIAPSLSQNLPPNINVNQSLPPNIVSSMSSHLVTNVPPNISSNISTSMNQNLPFDIGQNIINNMPQIPSNSTHNISTSIQQCIPSIMSQNVQSVNQTLPSNNISVNIQNSPNVGQILPSSMAQSIMPNIAQNMPPNISQNIIPNMTQTLPPYMSQSNMSQTIAHPVGQISSIMGQSITPSSNPNVNMNQNVAPVLSHSMPSSLVPSVSPMIPTNTTNVTNAIPLSVSNNMTTQNMALNMQPVIGQMSISVGPTMVPPPSLMHGNVTQSMPNMTPVSVMPPNMSNSRPQLTYSAPQPSMSIMPPPPPPTSIQAMSTQPPYPYWMG